MNLAHGLQAGILSSLSVYLGICAAWLFLSEGCLGTLPCPEAGNVLTMSAHARRSVRILRLSTSLSCTNVKRQSRFCLH